MKIYNNFPSKKTILGITVGCDFIPQVRVEYVKSINKKRLLVGWLFWTLSIKF